MSNFDSAIRANVGEREELNIRTFTKWINSKLNRTQPRVVVNNLIEDLRDGRVLLSLLEVLMKIKLRREKGKLKLHQINNVETVLKTLEKEIEKEGLKLHGITSGAIVDGNHISILGLVWIIILHFQVHGAMVQEEEVEEKSSKKSQRKSTTSQADIERLLVKWAQELLKSFSDVVTIQDITKSWQNGLAFIYLLFVFRPNVVDVDKAQRMTVPERLDYAFNVAEDEFNVHRLLEPSDVDRPNVDKKSMLMYLSSLYEVLRDMKPANIQVVEEPIAETTTTVVESAPSATLQFGDEVIEITTVSKNEIVLELKIIYHEIIIIMKQLESKMAKIQAEEPSQKNTVELQNLKRQMMELQPKISKLNETNKQMVGADNVDREEFSEIQADIKDLSARWSTLIQQTKDEDKRQPPLTRTVVQGGRSARLQYGDEVIEITTISINEIVLQYKILYYEIIIIIKRIEGNMEIIKAEKPGQRTAILLDENKQRMAQLQPKIAQLNEMMKEMEGAEGVDANELAELQSELVDFNSRLSNVTEQINEEEKRQPELTQETVYKTSTTVVQAAPSARVQYGDEVIEITTISINEIVLQYKILYYEIITIIKLIEANIEIIRAEKPSQGTAILLEENKQRMAQLQPKISQLIEMSKEMEGADGVDANELAELKSELNEFNSRLSNVNEQMNEEEKRITGALDSSSKEKTALDEWRKKCEAIGDWMDSIEDIVEAVETNKPSSDPMIVQQQMDECEQLQDKIESDEVPRSTFSFGEELVNGSSVSPEKRSKIGRQITEMKSEIQKLSDRAGAAKHRYKRAMDKLQAEKRQMLVELQATYEDLDQRIDQLRAKDNHIGKVEGDPIIVRGKETEIELLVTDIQMFQPHFDDFRQTAWEVMEDPNTDETTKEKMKKQLNSLEERWGVLIRSVYSRSEAAKNLIAQLPQGGVLEELIIVENVRHDYSVDWGTHQDLFGSPDEGEDVAMQLKIYRDRLMTRWRRECREVDEGLADVERESKELGEIENDPSQVAMQKAKLKVILMGLNNLDKEYNDLPEFAKTLLEDPKLTQEDRNQIQTDLSSYTSRYETLRELVLANEERMKKNLPESDVIVTENYVMTEHEPPTDWITTESIAFEESEPEQDKALQTFIEYQLEYKVLVTWIITVEKRLQEVKNDRSDNDQALRKRRVVIVEIIEEITTYEIRLRELTEKIRALSGKDSIPSEEMGKLLTDMDALEKKLEKVNTEGKELEKEVDAQLQSNSTKYEDWQAKADDLDKWFLTIRTELKSVEVSTSDPAEREKQKRYLEDFERQKREGDDRVDDVVTSGQNLIIEGVVPAEKREKVESDLESIPETWNDLVQMAEKSRETVESSQKDLQQFTDNQREYQEIITWIIICERRLLELRGDQSGDDEALRKRRIVIMEIIEEITIYRIRLQKLVEKNKELSDKDTIPLEEREKFSNDVKLLRTRLDKIDDEGKEQVKQVDEKLSNNSAEYEDWQTKADDLDKWFITVKTELRAVQAPTSDPDEREKQKKYLEDFENQKKEGDDRVENVVTTGRKLVEEGVVPAEKREKVELDLESFPETWNDLLQTAEDSRKIVEAGENDLQQFADNQREYEEIITWTIVCERRLQELRGDESGQDEALRKRCIVITEIIEEITIYRIRLQKLTEKNKELSDKDTIPLEEREKFSNDVELLQTRLDKIYDEGKEQEKQVDEKLNNNSAEYEDWQTKADDLDKWLITIKTELKAVQVPTSGPDEREKQKKYLEDFENQKKEGDDRVENVVTTGRKLVEEGVVPAEKREKVQLDLESFPETWNDLVQTAEDSRKIVEAGENDLQQFADNQREYEEIITWTIVCERRLQELRGDESGQDEALRKRRIVITEIIEEITIYRIRLQKLIEKNKELSDKDTIPLEEREKFSSDVELLQTRLDKIYDEGKEQEKQVDEKLNNNSAEYEDWQTKADDLDKWLITIKTELKAVQAPTSDPEEREKQKKYLEDFENGKKEGDDRVKYVVITGRKLVDEAVVPAEKREKVQLDLERFPGTWDDAVQTAEESRKLLDGACKSEDDYKIWCDESDDAIKMVKKIKEEIQECSQPTSDIEERKRSIARIDNIISEKPKYDERVTKVLLLRKSLEDGGYLTPEQQERVAKETDELENDWKDVAQQLDDVRKSSEAGMDDAVKLSEWRKDYEVITIWITKMKRAFTPDDQPAQDLDSLIKRREEIQEDLKEVPSYESTIIPVLDKGRLVSQSVHLSPHDKQKTQDELDALNRDLEEIKKSGEEKNNRVNQQIENWEKYEKWQNKADDLDKWFVETRETLDKCDVPSNDVTERERQQKFLNDFNENKSAQDKQVTDVVNTGRHLIDENIVPDVKREQVELVLQTFPGTWDNLVDRADGQRETADASLQDVILLNKWREEYMVILLWVEKAEDKQNQREDVGDDLDKSKKQLEEIEGDVEEITEYETKITPFINQGEVLAQSKFLPSDDTKHVEDDTISLKKRFEKLKSDETDRKQKLDVRIQWLTEYKGYKTGADSLKITLEDYETKLESYEKPTSSKAERDKQAVFLNKFSEEKLQNDKLVENTVQLGNRLADGPSVSEDKRDEMKEETKNLEETWRILVTKVEVLQKIVSSGIQNITELSEWRKEYTVVIKWIETTEKKLIAQGEPGTDPKDLAEKCSDLEEMVSVLATYETRVVLLLEKGGQLSKESSIDENDRAQTEADTKSLVERWEKLKKDEEEQKKRYDEQKSNVNDYSDWRDELADVKPWLENTKSELDACEQPTSDHGVREKQKTFLKVFMDDKEKNQSRVDSLVKGGNHLVTENPVAQQDAEKIKEDIKKCEDSWKTILLRFDVVEKTVASGSQDIIQLEEWRKNCHDLTKSLDNARIKVRDLGEPDGDSSKIESQKDQFELITQEMNSVGGQIDDLSQKADYLVNESTIHTKDKESVRVDMDNLNNSWKNYKNEESATRTSFDDNLSKLHKFNEWKLEVNTTNEWLDGLQETVESAEKPTEDPQVRKEQLNSLQMFLDNKEDNQKRVDEVIQNGNELVERNHVPKDKQGEVNKDVQGIKDTWNSTLQRSEKLYTVITSYVIPVTSVETIPVPVAKQIEVQEAGESIDDLFREMAAPPAQTGDYGEWKTKVGELERVLDEYDGKLDPQSDIEKDYSNLERLAQETKDAGDKVDRFCKPKLAEIRSTGEILVQSEALGPDEKEEIKEKISSLGDRTSRIDTSVMVVRMKVRDAALDYFNDILNKCSNDAISMQKTAKALRPPANDLPGIRIQVASYKSLEKRVDEDEKKVRDTEDNVNTMEDSGVLPRDGFAGTLNDRCTEVRKEQEVVKKYINEAKPRLHRALLNQYIRTQKEVTKWLKQCEKKEKNVLVDNLDGVDPTYGQFLKLKEAEAEYDKGVPKYNTYLEVHKMAKDDNILTDKKASEADRQQESLTNRHDELQKNLNEKEEKLRTSLLQTLDEILDSVEEKVKEGESWVEPEDPADDFRNAKEQQDRMRERKQTLKERQPALLKQLDHLSSVDKIVSKDLLSETERTNREHRINDVRRRLVSILPAAETKSQQITEIYVLLLRREIDKRKAWLVGRDESDGVIDTNFKDFNEFKDKYDHNKALAKELDENSIEVLATEADKIDGIEPAVKDELKDLNQRWRTLHDASEEKSKFYENIMTTWLEFREQQLTILNWVDEKDREIAAKNNQVNFADENDVKEQIELLKSVKQEDELQGGAQSDKLNKAGTVLIDHLGENHPTAEEITKQMQEVDSCRKEFITGIDERLEKIETGERKTRDLYTNMDDISSWLDSTDELIDKYEGKGGPGEGEGTVDVDDEVQEETVHVVEELLANRKLIPEKQETLDDIVKNVGDLDGVLDESATETAETKVNQLTDRWNVVTKRLDTFFSRDIPEMEIIEIKSERLGDDLDETDLKAVLSMDQWKSKVRKVNLLLKYLERLVIVKADVKGDFPTIRILSSNSKEATKTLKQHCQPRMKIVTALGQNIIDNNPENTDQNNEISETMDALTNRIEKVEHNADVLKMKVRDLALVYFNECLNQCEINLEREEENVAKLMTAKADLETTKEQLVLMTEGRKEYNTNEQHFQEVSQELNDKKISEFLTKEGFHGTLLEKNANISRRRGDVAKKLTESQTRIYRDLVLYLAEKKRVLVRWLTACEKKEKTIKVEPATAIVPEAEYKKLQALRRDLDDGEGAFQETTKFNKQLITDSVLEGRRAVNSEKEFQGFIDRYLALRQRINDKHDILYSLLLVSVKKSMDEVDSNLTELEVKVDGQTLSDTFPQVKQDFQTAQTVKEEVDTVTANSSTTLKHVHTILALNVFTEDDAEVVSDRRNCLKDKNAKLSEKADEKFENFSKQYNRTIEKEVELRKMWLDSNSSLLSIVDDDVDDLPGFEKKLKEQKTFDEELEHHNMDGFVDEAENNNELDQNTKELIYQLHERWHAIKVWSDERNNKLTKIITCWKNLCEQEKELVKKIDERDIKLREISVPVDLTNSGDTKKQRNNLKDLQTDVQKLVLPLIQIKKSAKALTKLVGVDSPAAKQIEKQVEDLDTCHGTLSNDTLARIKKLDSSERKTKVLYHHMFVVKSSMDENDNILNSLNKQIDKQEEENVNSDEGIELEERETDQDNAEESKRKSQADLNEFVDQISLRLGDRPIEKARIERAKELEHDLEEDLGVKAKEVLKRQVEEFDGRWEDLSKKMDEVVQGNDSAEIEPTPIKTYQIQDVQAAPPGDDGAPADYNSWNGVLDDVNESMEKSQVAMQQYDVDVNDYPSLRKAETETQDIIDQMNTQYKPKLITLRTSGEKISVQDDAVSGEEITKRMNSSQKNLEGLQSALELRKLRLRDSSIQHINERIRDCEANVGKERVNLQLLTPTGKSLESVLEQLSHVEDSEKTFRTNQKHFEEIQLHLNEIRQSKIFASPEFNDEFQEDCKEVALQRAFVLKQIREHRIKLYRSVVNIFDVKRKDVAKWLKNCEKKENEVDSNAQVLDSALAALSKLKDAENTVELGEQNYHETVSLAKIVSEHQLLEGKKAADVEQEIKTASLRYNQILENIQEKKNKLYKTVYGFLSKQLDEIENEIKKGEDVVQTESQPEDPTATLDELGRLQVLLGSSVTLREESAETFDKANVFLSFDVLPDEDKKELRKRVIVLEKRAYELPGDAKMKYDQIYKVYISHLATIIRLRKEWITANEPRMEQPETTDASDISELENEIKELEDFEIELDKNNVESVIQQLQDTDDIDPEVQLSDLLSLGKRWDALDSWMENRKQFLRKTSYEWRKFRDQERALLTWMDAKDNELKELDNPVNLADENAVQQRLEALKKLQLDMVQHSPNLVELNNSGNMLMHQLKPASKGWEQVKKQIEDFKECWMKLEQDVKLSIDKMEKSEKTIKAIYSYMDIVNSWLDEIDGSLEKLNSSERKLVGPKVDGTTAVAEDEEHGVDGEELPRIQEEGEHGREGTGDEIGQLSDEDKEHVQEEIRKVKDELKANLHKRDLNKVRTERVHLLVDDIHGSVDEEGENKLRVEIQNLDERWLRVQTQLDDAVKSDVSTGVDPELIRPEISTTVESSPLEAEPMPEGSTVKTEGERTPIEPYAGKPTLDLKEWRSASSNLREFLIRMQMNIRDIDSTDYVQMRECELDTKMCIDAMKNYGRPCLNDILVSGHGMLDSPEYTPEEKNEIRATMETLTVSAQFVHNNAEDQRQRLYRSLVVYQNDQRKVVQRWLNTCTKKAKEINEEAVGLEASSAEFKEVQELKSALVHGQPIYQNYTELSRRMVQNEILEGRKASETEKDMAGFAKTYDDLKIQVERKEKRLYITVVKSISLPLQSIEQSVHEAETWVEPQDLSDNYDQAHEQLNKMKLSVFVIETLHTRSGKVLNDTNELVSTHDVLSPDDKQNIKDRIKGLLPRTEALPAAAVNKYKRMYCEYLVLLQSEVELRGKWIEKNESRMTSSPVGDTKSLDDLLLEKDKHDEFSTELRRYDMTSFMQESESMRELGRENHARIRDLHKRWLVLSYWSKNRTTFLTSLIANWQVFREYEVTAQDFIDTKEKQIEQIDQQANVMETVDTKEQLTKLEKIQDETQANSLEIWKLHRQYVVLVKQLGEDSEAAKLLRSRTEELAEKNEMLCKEIGVRVNKLEYGHYKTSKLDEVIESVNGWVIPTEKLIDNFYDIATKLKSQDEDAAKSMKDESSADKSEEASPEDEPKISEEELRVLKNRINICLTNIAEKRVGAAASKAQVDRVNQLQSELQDDLDESNRATVGDKVEKLNSDWETVNSRIDKVAWERIPGISSLQARTYLLHDIKVSSSEEIPPVETVEAWKDKVAELERLLTETEAKIDPQKSIESDFKEFQTLLADLQDCQSTVNENCLPKLEKIRVNGVQLYKDSEDKQSSESADQQDGEHSAMKSELSTIVLSLHERTQNLQSSVELQKLRLRDVLRGYFYKRLRNDETNLSHEQVQSKKLFPIGEDVEKITLQLDIIKESENEFAANERTFQETQEQFGEIKKNQVVDVKSFENYMLENTKNLVIQRKTLWKLLVDIKQKLHRSILNKYNDGKTNLTKWLKSMERRERNVDFNVVDVEKVYTECSKLKTIEGELPEGQENYKRLLTTIEEIQVEKIFDEAKMTESKAELDALGERLQQLQQNIESKQKRLSTRIKGNLDQTLNSTEASISEAETCAEPSSLSENLDQAMVEIEKSMENVTNVNNIYTMSTQRLERPQEMAQSGVLSDEINSDIEFRCRDLSKRVSRLPSAVFRKHKSLFEEFTILLYKVILEREKWISENESCTGNTLVTVAGLEDLTNKIKENENFNEEVKKYNMEPIIIELEKMGDPDFKLKATSKDLQSRWSTIDTWAKERGVVLRSILEEWTTLREQMKTLVEWIDSKDVKLKELKEQVNLADEKEVEGQLTDLKAMQTEMDDTHSEIVKLKKASEGLKRILGDDSQGTEQIEAQISEFNTCWDNLGKEIHERIRKLESSERQVSTMQRYMDQTENWMEEIEEIINKHETGARRLAGLPVESETQRETASAVEGTPKSGEGTPEGGGAKLEQSEEGEGGEKETKKDDEAKELDEDEKEKLQEDNKRLVETFVMKRRYISTCQAFVDWAEELEKEVEGNLDDESKEAIRIKVEQFKGRWNVFLEKMYGFSDKEVQEIRTTEWRLAEVQMDEIPELLTLEDWKTKATELEGWYETMKGKCDQETFTMDSAGLKKREQAANNLVVELTQHGQPQLNRLIFLGRNLIDAKTQTPDEEQEITVTITKLSKTMIEVERMLELQKIRTLETIVGYCRETLELCETKVERDEKKVNQLSPSGSTPEAVHDQILLLRICEKDIPENDAEFKEISMYITDTRHLSFSNGMQVMLERICRVLESRRTVVHKLMRESRLRLYRAMVNFFDQRKKVILKWLTNCEKKQRQVKPDVEELRESCVEYVKVKEVRKEFDEGRQNYFAFIELHKTVAADEVLEGKKASEAERDANMITGRVQQLDKVLHDQETKLYHTLFRTLTHLLDNIETAISEARGWIKPDEIISTYFKTAKKQVEETKAMALDVGAIHRETSSLIDQADEVKSAKLLGPEDADTVELRISDLTKKCTDIQTSASGKEFRMRAEYVTTFKTELQRCSQWITFLELRVQKIDGEADDYHGYQQLNEDHMRFEEDLKVYDLTILSKEVDKIEELEDSVRQELSALEKRWRKLLKWSGERTVRLSKIVSLWSKFRVEEMAVLAWIDQQDAKLKEVKDDINLADEKDVGEQLDILMGVRREMESYAVRLTEIESMGLELKRIVGDHSNAGNLVQKQLDDLDQVYNERLKQVLQRIDQLESAQRRIKSMLADMDVVMAWTDETEVFLNEFDEKEKQLLDLDKNQSKQAGTSGDRGEQEAEKETKKQRKERIKEEKASVRQEMITLVEKLAVKFEKLQVYTAKVEHVNATGNELKEEIDESAQKDFENQLEQFNNRWNTVSNRLKDFPNKDLPQSADCFFVRLLRRTLFRAS